MVTLRRIESLSLDPIVRIEREHTGAVNSVTIEEAEARAAADPRIRLCDMRTGAFTHSLPGHRGTVLGVDWSPRHEFILASASTDSTARLWDIRKSNSCLISLDFHNSGTHPLSEEIYTAGNDHSILIWAPRNKQRESAQQFLAEQDTWSDSDEEDL
ncbi:DNA excision repair protein ERCC-8 [Actinomortierella wolfii]|nr:DNA excision repair protein ERCC-8 [Actinomortierella wolfii]